MSEVNNVIIVCDCDDVKAFSTAWEDIQHGQAQGFARVERWAGGHKRMEVAVLAAALNHVGVESVLAVVSQVAWRYPKSVSVFAQEQHEDRMTQRWPEDPAMAGGPEVTQERSLDSRTPTEPPPHCKRRVCDHALPYDATGLPPGYELERCGHSGDVWPEISEEYSWCGQEKDQAIAACWDHYNAHPGYRQAREHVRALLVAVYSSDPEHYDKVTCAARNWLEETDG
jgi:hypothetical protein